jgi:sortase A
MTNSRRRALSKVRRLISNALLLAGIIGVGICVWSIVRGALFQSRANREFDEQTRSAPPPSSAPPSSAVTPLPEPGALIGRLMIPRLHLRAMVREGTDEDTLDVALGHVRGTALPGGSGNVAIAGHRDTLFRCLRDISKDDSIVFQTTHGSYTYDVETTAIVKPQDVGVLAPGSRSEITLVTCYPFHYVGPAPDRFIVRARLLPPKPAGQGPAWEPRNSSSPGKKLLSRRIKPPARHSGLRLPDECLRLPDE